MITVNLAKLPIIKNLQIETTNIKHMDAPNAEKRFEQVDLNLAEVKTKQKNGNRDLEMEVQKEYSNLQKVAFIYYNSFNFNKTILLINSYFTMDDFI